MKLYEKGCIIKIINIWMVIIMSSYSHSNHELFGEILRNFRTENNYTQQKIADYLGIERSTYAKYELNRKPDLDIIVQLALLYEVTVDELLGDYKSKAVSPTNNKPFAKAAAPANGSENRLSLEETRLINLFRKSIRKNEVITFARRIAAEDSASSNEIK